MLSIPPSDLPSCTVNTVTVYGQQKHLVLIDTGQLQKFVLLFIFESAHPMAVWVLQIGGLSDLFPDISDSMKKGTVQY